jgi:hypothetical protein
MAIKILKQGTKKKVECPECGSLLSYDEAEDVEKGNEKRYGNGELYNRRYEYMNILLVRAVNRRLCWRLRDDSYIVNYFKTLFSNWSWFNFEAFDPHNKR